MFFGPDGPGSTLTSAFNRPLEGFVQGDATFQLRGGWELNGHVERDFVNFQDSSFAGYTIGSAGRPGVPAHRRFLRVRSGDRGDDAHLAASSAPTCSTAGDGSRSSRRARPARVAGRPARWASDRRRRCAWPLTGTAVPALPARRAGVRPLHHSAAQGGVPAHRVALLPRDRRVPLGAAGGARRSGHRRALCRGRAAQPATEFNGLRVDLLASFEPTPGTVAFLGYGSSLETDGEFNWSRLEPGNDGFFVKLAYQYRQ